MMYNITQSKFFLPEDIFLLDYFGQRLKTINLCWTIFIGMEDL